MGPMLKLAFPYDIGPYFIPEIGNSLVAVIIPLSFVHLGDLASQLHFSLEIPLLKHELAS